jgi:PAS domain S-box-containing protein
MTLHVAISLLALFSYLGLLVIVLHHGLRRNRPSQVFSLYLFDMMLMQTALLMVSLADSSEQALLWYTLIIPVGCAQSIIYYFFTRTLLSLRQSRRWIEISILIWLPITILAVAFRPDIYTDIYQDQATGIFVPEFGPLVPVLTAPILLFLGLAIFNLVRGCQSTRSPRQRMRFQYLLLAVSMYLAGMTANFVPALQPYPIDVAANVLSALIITYAILRHHLLDINIVVRKGLLYSIPTAILGAGYFLIIYFATRILHGLGGPQIFLLSLVVAIVAAVAAQPVRDWAQHWIDKVFFRDKYDGSVMIQRLSQSATSVLDLNKLAHMILNDVTATMHVQWAALLLKGDRSEDLRLMAHRGLDTPADLRLAGDHPLLDILSSHKEALAIYDLNEISEHQGLGRGEIKEFEKIETELFVPLRAGGQLVGALVMGPKLARQSYSRHDELILTTLANQTAVAVDNARLHQAVRQELTERVRTEQALRQSEERYRQLVEHAPAGIFEIDTTNGKFISVNDVMCEYMGYTREEFLALTALDLLTQESLELFVERQKQTFVGEAIPETVEYQVRGKNDRQFWVLLNTKLEYNDKGTPIKATVVVHDITERKLLEERLRQAQKLEAVGVLAGGIAHEFNNLLTAINGFAELMQLQLPPDDPLQETAGKILGAGWNAADLVRQLLAFSRKQIIQPQVLDLNAVLVNMGVMLHRTIGEYIQMETTLTPDLWLVKVDPVQIKQVIIRLAVNARDAMPEGGTLIIQTANVVLDDDYVADHPAVQSGENVLLMVSDTGTGMSEEVKTHVFEPFFTTKEVGTGTGLGLATVYGFVKQSGGDIQVHSQEGRGTTFNIYLPRAEEEATPVPSQA